MLSPANTRAVPKTLQKHSPIKIQHKSNTTSKGYTESSEKTARRKGGRKPSAISE